MPYCLLDFIFLVLVLINCVDFIYEVNVKHTKIRESKKNLGSFFIGETEN